jgi:hypothetical protein
MNVNENTDIIYIVDSVFNDTEFCCNGNKEDIQQGKRLTLTYTKPVLFSKYYPMLWVHLDSSYRVCNVYAKRYEFIDDICIYSLSWKIDSINLEKAQYKSVIFINEELFNKCFAATCAD